MRIALALLCLAGWSTPALACDCVRLDPAAPRFAADVDRIGQHYPVAAEGIIEAEGLYAWRFRPSREYRGLGKEFYSIELISDCSLDPQEMKRLIGKPVFLVLAAGSGSYQGRYEASRCVNLLGGDAEAALRARFAAACTPR